MRHIYAANQVKNNGNVWRLLKSRKTGDTQNVASLLIYTNNPHIKIYKDDEKEEVIADRLLINHKITRNLSDSQTEI